MIKSSKNEAFWRAALKYIFSIPHCRVSHARHGRQGTGGKRNRGALGRRRRQEANIFNFFASAATKRPACKIVSKRSVE